LRRVKQLASTAPFLVAALLAGGCGVTEQRASDVQGAVGSGLGSPATATKDTVRFPGADPVENAADIASAVFPGTSAASRPEAVTLVRNTDWQGAIAASVFAGEKVKAPVLLTDSQGVPQVTADAIARLNPTGIEGLDGVRAIRVGDAALPPGTKAQAAAGADPYTRAAAIDRLFSGILGRPAGHVILASGEQSPWAMPAAAWAARGGNPVLFTRATAVPQPTLAALKAHKKPHVYLMGPESVVGKEVEKAVRPMAKDVTRIDAPTPVELSVEFARFSRATFGWGFVAPGHNFTVASATSPLDAAAAAALGSNGVFAPLLLTKSPDLSREVENYLLDVQPGYQGDPSAGVFNRAFIVGDEDEVSAAAQGRLDEITGLVPVTIEG
jgi:hypothetical protein